MGIEYFVGGESLMKYLILCGSVTNVQKASDAFRRNGRLAHIGRAPMEITEKHGCSYTLNTTVPPDEATRILRDAKLYSTHIYAVGADGTLQAVR